MGTSRIESAYLPFLRARDRRHAILSRDLSRRFLSASRPFIRFYGMGAALVAVVCVVNLHVSGFIVCLVAAFACNAWYKATNRILRRWRKEDRMFALRPH